MQKDQDLFGMVPRLDDARMALANGFLKCGAEGGVWSLVGLMRVSGMDVANHFIPQITRCVSGRLNDDTLTEIHTHLPNALARIKRKSQEVETRYIPLKSSLEHWRLELGYEKDEGVEVSDCSKVYAAGFVFSQLLESFHRQLGGNTLVGCCRDLGLKADNNEYVTVLSYISKHGINGVPPDSRADFCAYLLDAHKCIRDRFSYFRSEAERLIGEC